MVRIYCQYSVSGFKIFQLNALPHAKESVKFVKMMEVTNAIHGAEQDFVITGTNDCNLDRRIMRLFSMNGISLLYLRNIGEKGNEYALYLNDPAKTISFAFVANEDKDQEVLFKIATKWLSSEQKELLNLLQKIAGMMVVDGETVFAYHEDVWQQLLQESSKIMLSSKDLEIFGNGEKNILSYLVRDKSSILKNARIEMPISSFIMIPGNEEVRMAERNRKIIKYATIGITVCIGIGMALYCYSNK